MKDSQACSGSLALGREEEPLAVGHHYGEPICIGVRERGREREGGQNGSCPVERGRSEEAKAVRSKMMWVTCLPPWKMLTSLSGGPRLGQWPATAVVCVDVCGSCYN